MQFATVSGVIGKGETNGWFMVLLHTGEDSVVVRDEPIPEALVDADPRWLIDQLVQETLGNELAEQGWEVIAVSEPVNDDALRSRNWTVRHLG
jgi:hypothetical protein